MHRRFEDLIYSKMRWWWCWHLEWPGICCFLFLNRIELPLLRLTTVRVDRYTERATSSPLAQHHLGRQKHKSRHILQIRARARIPNCFNNIDVIRVSPQPCWRKQLNSWLCNVHERYIYSYYNSSRINWATVSLMLIRIRTIWTYNARPENNCDINNDCLYYVLLMLIVPQYVLLQLIIARKAYYIIWKRSSTWYGEQKREKWYTFRRAKLCYVINH